MSANDNKSRLNYNGFIMWLYKKKIHANILLHTVENFTIFYYLILIHKDK